MLTHAVRNAPKDSSEIIYRSEEHTSELQSHSDLVCRLLLEKKNKIKKKKIKKKKKKKNKKKITRLYKRTPKSYKVHKLRTGLQLEFIKKRNTKPSSVLLTK